MAGRAPFGNGDNAAFEDAFDILKNDARKRARISVCPKGVKFCLDPGDGFGIIVFPKQFVMATPGFARLIDGAEEGRRPPILIADDAGFAMNEPEGFVGQDTNFDPFILEQA